MVWEKLSTPVQKESLRRSLAVSMSRIPLDVVNAIRSFPQVTFLDSLLCEQGIDAKYIEL